MAGNEKIGITAEAVALMKSQAGDRFSSYFVTPRIIKLNERVGRLFSKDLLADTFARRLSLSEDMGRFAREFQPEQLIYLGSGVDTFLLQYALAHPKTRVLGIDLPKITSFAQTKLEEIKKEEHLGRVPNLHLIPADVSSEDFMERLKPFFQKGKLTLDYSVGLNTYLNSGQYHALLTNGRAILEQSAKGSAILAHDQTREQMNKMKSSLGAKALRGLVSVITTNRQHVHYYNESDLREKLAKQGFSSY
jgi:O-methyltransferase involved in polyketide biosynthesis